jgi:hypothetical protein
MKHTLHTASLLLLLPSLGIVGSGCATIVAGPSQEVDFQSQPDGATVSLNGTVIGKTPMATTLKDRASRRWPFPRTVTRHRPCS